MLETIITGGLVGAGVMALFGFTLKHCVNGDRHPKKSDLVFKDVCTAERKRISESFDHVATRIAEMKSEHKERFDRLEALIGKLNNH